MLDIVLFRVDQGGNPDLVRESQRRRYADVSLVDKVIEADDKWRQSMRHFSIASPAHGLRRARALAVRSSW